MRKFSLSIETKIVLTEEDITDIVIEGLEHGIGYWSILDNTGKEYEEAPEDEPVAITTAKLLLSGKSVLFEDIEDENEKWELTLEKLLAGIQMYLNTPQGKGCLEGDLEECVVNTCMVDADTADAMFQYALFGDIVFG